MLKNKMLLTHETCKSFECSWYSALWVNLYQDIFFGVDVNLERQKETLRKVDKQNTYTST